MPSDRKSNPDDRKSMPADERKSMPADDKKTTPAKRPHRGWVRLLTALVGILTVLAIISSWVDRQAFNTDEWGSTSIEMLQDPAIQAQIADFAVNELYENVDVDKELKEILPGDLKSFSGIAAGGLRQFADQGARKALENRRVQDAWRTANVAAHKTLVDVIEDRSDVLSTTGGQVSLELRPLIIDIASEVGLGQQARDNVPASVGSIDIVNSDELSTVQTVTKLIHGTALITSLLAIILLGLAVWLSPGYRWLTLLWLGVTLIFAGVLVLIIRSVLGGVVVPELADVNVQPAAQAAWNIGTDLLRSIAWTVIWSSLVLFALSWLTSPSRSAERTREFLAVPVGRYPGFALGLLALAAFVFLLTGAGDERVFLMRLVIVIIAFGGAWLFRRQLITEYPDADMEGLREFRQKTSGSLRRLWSGRPKKMTDIPGMGDASPKETDTAVLREPETGGLRGMQTSGLQPDPSAPVPGEESLRRDEGSGAPGEAGTAVFPEDPGSPAPGPDRLEQLEKLGRLHQSGVLTDEEFTEEKDRIRKGS